MPNTSLSRLLRALGDFTTTIFIPYASLSSQYRLSQPKPRRPSQAPATKTARVPGRNSSTAPAPHRAAAARAFLPSNVKTAASLHWFCPSIRTGRRLCSSPDADKKTGGGSCRPLGVLLCYSRWLRITSTAPDPTAISITEAAGSLLTVRVSPRVSSAPSRGYLTPRKATPFTVLSREMRDR